MRASPKATWQPIKRPSIDQLCNFNWINLLLRLSRESIPLRKIFNKWGTLSKTSGVLTWERETLHNSSHCTQLQMIRNCQWHKKMQKDSNLHIKGIENTIWLAWSAWRWSIRLACHISIWQCSCLSHGSCKDCYFLKSFSWIDLPSQLSLFHRLWPVAPPVPDHHPSEQSLILVQEIQLMLKCRRHHYSHLHHLTLHRWQQSISICTHQEVRPPLH